MITDGAAGNERQALALAEALGVPTRVWQVAPAPPWRWLAPRGVAGARLALPASTRAQFMPPWPDLAIGCGRAAALYTRGLRRWSQGRTFCVQILDPRIDPAQWNLVVAPRHDGLSGANVLVPLGSLNPIDDAWLAAGAEAFPDLAAFPAPRTVVLIGANHRDVAVSTEYCVGLVERLGAFHARFGGSFLVSTSRRTPVALRDFLRSAFARFPGCFWGGAEDGANPYAGYLAHADRIVVTPDSVNMLSEACAVGVPVSCWLPTPPRGKLGRFHAALAQEGWVQPLTESGSRAQPGALRETERIADEVRQRLVAHRMATGHCEPG
ncbi:mitochondrial fission ELM1 family protein [Tahibacter amnicola]|uniref:Mitochondrial fission ELM1 family protein n=1 Tax=Tahibacter amnicola TaxID=2976241 RepID=A0ABY6BFW5_9GAMM|nr:mitochondrial fission ELM1 family protein [Tahibacter amnicola]UXI68918.1 mitochondrial fission ELM1 family protein [Tahibacter amnicola]